MKRAVIDTDGSGFHMTCAAAGIQWDLYGDGHPIHTETAGVSNDDPE